MCASPSVACSPLLRHSFCCVSLVASKVALPQFVHHRRLHCIRRSPSKSKKPIASGLVFLVVTQIGVFCIGFMDEVSSDGGFGWCIGEEVNFCSVHNGEQSSMIRVHGGF
ncbi:hypothetical protein V8G54_032670 [Vigna mungo]|uniref:Transmembrane protein n=1 Tax=Vigna mungo TaxID=3915 RepID=A0AAQ3RI58_VIGMU